jgi:hypothetical protein
MVSSAAASAQSERTSIPEMIAEWVRQGTEGFIATQKILLDLAAQQNALALTVIRERVGLIPPAPLKALTDLTAKCLQNFIQAQQIILDIAARQNCIIADGLKPMIAGTPADRLSCIVHEGIDSFIAGQKKFLQLFESEAEGAIKDFGHRKPFDRERVTDLARDSVRTFVKSQKKFLDVVEEQLTAKKEVPEENKGVDLLEMAKQSIDAFVDAERKLLDLASDQINVNVRFVKDAFDSNAKSKTTTLPDVMKKSVESFVAAQKALAELASKPRKAGVDHVDSHVVIGKPLAKGRAAGRTRH